jgi:hypothetical protein
MKQSGTNQAASTRISKRIAELGDWRGETLSRMRTLLREADPDIVEEVKWVKPTNPGTPTWSHDGIICTGESSPVFESAPRGAAAHPYNERICPDPTPPLDFFEVSSNWTGPEGALIQWWSSFPLHSCARPSSPRLSQVAKPSPQCLPTWGRNRTSRVGGSERNRAT